MATPARLRQSACREQVELWRCVVRATGHLVRSDVFLEWTQYDS